MHLIEILLPVRSVVLTTFALETSPLPKSDCPDELMEILKKTVGIT